MNDFELTNEHVEFEYERHGAAEKLAQTLGPAQTKRLMNALGKLAGEAGNDLALIM